MAAIRAIKGVHGQLNAFKTQKHISTKTKPIVSEYFQNFHACNLFEKAVSTKKLQNKENKQVQPLQELHKALFSNQIAQTQKIFSEKVKMDYAVEYDLETLYNTLKSDPNAKYTFDVFKKYIMEFGIKEAVSKNDPRILENSLIKECGIRKVSKDTLINALKGLANVKSTRIANAITSISKIPLSRHNLQPIDMLGICVAAEKQFEKGADKTDVIYKRAKDLQTCRACVFDFANHTFTILSKSNGELNASGAFKRVSDAIEVSIADQTAVARRVAHVRNKADEWIPKSELHYEQKYGEIISWVRYNSKNRPYETKTLLLQEVYDHDLYIFTEFTPEDIRKRISLSDMIKVLEDAGKTLTKIHAHGLVHRDVKAKNILYRKNKNGEVEAKLIDFGHVYRPRESTQLKKRTKGYGTLRYTAPDLLEKPDMKGDPLKLAQAEDAYAFGECIYEVYLQLATPWGGLSYRALKKKGDYEEHRKTAIKLQKKEAALLAEESGMGKKTAEKELFWIMSRLLEPNPKKRMTMPEFMSALYDLKANYATLLAV